MAIVPADNEVALLEEVNGLLDEQNLSPAFKLRYLLQEPVSALPASGFIGETIRYKVTAGVYWEFLYTGEATYPWAYIGGPSIAAEETAAIEVGSATYVTTTPTLAIPLKGEYEIILSTLGYVKTACTWLMSYKIGATAAVDGDAVSATRATTFDELYSSRSKLKTFTEVVTLTTAIRNTAGSVILGNRRINAIPRRVGL